MLPGPSLLFELKDGDVRPRHLGRGDEPWLRELIELHDRCVGRKQRELDEALADAQPAGFRRRAWRAACHVLRQRGATSRDAAVPPRQARAELFGAAAGAPERRDATVAAVASRLEVEPDALLASLFADLPGERRILEPEAPITPAELALATNLANVQGLLYRASEVRLGLEGNARRVVQYSRARGLICAVAPGEVDGLTLVRLSGPYSLFRRTLIYGRALAGLVPQLGWCARYRLRAPLVLDRGEGILRLQSGDPILPAAEPPRFDSKLEERFARDFARAAPRWTLVREPRPFDAGGSLVYPDFGLQHADDPARRWYLEIAGFWTAGYLRQKLERYRRVGLHNLILCIDADRACSDGEVPDDARVVRYRRRVKPEDVLAVLDQDSQRRS